MKSADHWYALFISCVQGKSRLYWYQSAVEMLGNEALACMARELVREVRKSVTVDWTVRQSARARIRVLVKRILRRHGYPPDLQAKATKTVLEQAEVFAGSWG